MSGMGPRAPQPAPPPAGTRVGGGGISQPHAMSGALQRTRFIILFFIILSLLFSPWPGFFRRDFPDSSSIAVLGWGSAGRDLRNI